MKKLVLLVTTVFALYSCNIGKSNDSEKKINYSVDHGFHDNNWEWVYFSGIVKSDAGKEFSVMFTIFQQKSGQIYTYPRILAIFDRSESTLYERWDSTSTGVNFNESKTEIELKNARYKMLDNGNVSISGQFSSSTENFEVDLNLTPTLKPLAHGENGFIPMGDGVDSGYYSYTNMKPSGSIKIGNTSHTITDGRMWMDHQWGDWDSSTAMNWDWFSLRLDDGGALMLFQFRDSSNNILHGNWTYRDSSGNITYGKEYKVTAKDMLMLDYGTHTANYPIDWTVEIEKLDASFNITPVTRNQTVGSIWEGLCSMDGAINNQAITGEAFAELSGYIKAK